MDSPHHEVGDKEPTEAGTVQGAASQRVVLRVKGQHVPSFKNRKHSNRRGQVYCESKIKERMRWLEDAILSALYSTSPTDGSAMPLECLKARRTLLSGLSDDSVQEIPCGSWHTEYVQAGEEGVTIVINRLTP